MASEASQPPAGLASSSPSRIASKTIKMFKISDKVKVYSGHCKSTCSVSGEKVFKPTKYIWCRKRGGESEESTCEEKIEEGTEECEEESNTDCPPPINFGKWGCWTECEKSCTESLSDPEIMSRIRECKAKDKTICVGQLVQRKECPHKQCSNQGMYLHCKNLLQKKHLLLLYLSPEPFDQ